MNRKQAKQLLPIIKAYAEGKKIEGKLLDGTWAEMVDPIFNDKAERYRIKPEPKYRPFKDAEECWNEMQRHYPFGWLKKEGDYNFIDEVAESGLSVSDIDKYNYEEAFDAYTFADGTPFGIKEEK